MRISLDERFWAKVLKSKDECWLWTGVKSKHGYGQFRAFPNQSMQLAHRVSYSLTFGAIPKGKQVCHSCDVRACVSPSHLFIGTHLDNARDCMSKERQARGSANGGAKIKESDVHEIRRLHATGTLSQTVIGQRFGITQSAVSLIVIGKKWSHVKSQRRPFCCA